MTFANRMKKAIKANKWGRVLVEWRKRALYRWYLKRYNDKDFVCRLYQKRLGRPLNLEDPQLLMEKLQWLKLYYRDELMTVCSDKYEVKQYLAQKGYGHLAVETLAVFERADDITVDSLPPQFVLKATHGSGWNIVCRDKARFDVKYARRLAKIWLPQSAYLYGREWNYRDQTPRIIAEPLLCEKPLVDYKCMCFNGKVRAIQVNQAFDGVMYVDHYSADWKLWADTSTGVVPHTGKALEKPKCLDQMLEVACELSKPFPFVRVDFYEVNERLYVGEMTFFPGSGYLDFTPRSFDQMLGEWLTLPKKNYEEMGD